MGSKNISKKSFFELRFVYCIVVILAALILVAIIFMSINDAYSVNNSIDYSDMWTYENGSLVDFDEFKTDEFFSIHKRTNGEIIGNRALCFFSKNVYFTVYVDGEPIYDFHPKTFKFLGKSYGLYPHTVTMPILNKDGNILIEIENIYPGEKCYLGYISLSYSNQFLTSILQRATIPYVLCLIVFIFGYVVILIGLLGKYFEDNRYEIISLGALALMASTWIASGTQMVSVLTASPTAVHFTGYIALGLMSYPATVFAAFITGNKKTKLTLIVGIVTAMNLIVSVLSTNAENLDYHQLLRITHGILALAVLVIIILIIRGLITEKKTNKFKISIYISFFISLILGIVDIYRYLYHNQSYEKLSVFKYAIMLFILYSAIYEFVYIAEMSKKGKYAEIMEEMAYQDGLTGLMNRKAFNKSINKISEGETPYTFIMLDMNFLKLVNDRIGHIMGDTYIKSAAKCIASSFEECEGCYRIGGDEFFVMTKHTPSDPEFKECLDGLLNKIEAFNEENKGDIPLSIAYGIKEYDPNIDDVQDCIKDADKKMYDMKSKMKDHMSIASSR